MHRSKCTCHHGRPWYASCLLCIDEELGERIKQHEAESPAYARMRELVQRAVDDAITPET